MFLLVIILSFISAKTFYQFLYGAISILMFSLCIWIYWNYQKRRRYLESGIEDIDHMTGEQFEKCLMLHFNQLGYKSEPTAKSHDYGADLILKKNNEKIIIQAKRYNGKVGIKAIQETLGALSYYNASKGIVVTNSFFTNSAIELAKKSGIYLWDRNTIINNFHLHGSTNIINNNRKKACPLCGKSLYVRKGKYGYFYGCSGFPSCKYTENNK